MKYSPDYSLISKIIIVLIIIIFFINFKYSLFNYNSSEKFNNLPSDYNGFTTQSAGQGTLLCAKSCCSSGWPSSIDLDESILGINPGDMGTKFSATNLKCNNGFTTGCVCNKI
jgi:hypothetical protein